MLDDELEAAVDRGDVQAVKRALESGVSPNFEFAVKGVRESKSLLYLAAQVRELERKPSPICCLFVVDRK